MHVQPTQLRLGRGATEDTALAEAQDDALLAPSLRRHVYIETMGCQMNVSDTERMFEALHKAGKHQESIDTLVKAEKILGIPM